MNDDARLRDLLETAEQPRAPRAEFADRLRSELLGDDSATATLIDAAPPRPRGAARRWRTVVVAVGVAAAIVAAVLYLTADDDVGVDVDPSATTTETMTVELACGRFEATAFGQVTRQQLIGSRNLDFLEGDSIPRLVEPLYSALVRLRDDLHAAGVVDSSLDTDFERAIAAANSARIVDPALRDRVAGHLKTVDVALGDIDQRLVQLGHLSCS